MTWRRLVLWFVILAFLRGGVAAQDAAAEDAARKKRRATVRAHIERLDKKRILIGDFGGKNEWLNVSRPIRLHEELRGRVVLMDFWTYCCINCLHVLPDLSYLEKKYGDRPFAVIGCHSAKFDNEKDRAHVREAVVRHHIEHPVVVDDGHKIWQQCGVRAWPTLMILGPEGQVVGSVSGEGHRDLLDLFVDEALKYFGAAGKLAPRPIPMRLERDAAKPGALSYPGKVLVHEGTLFVADTNHNRVLAFAVEGDRATLTWHAGDGRIGIEDGPAEKARFFQPQGMAVHDGALYVADTENHAIRRIDLKTHDVTTIAGDGTQERVHAGAHKPKGFRLNSPWDLYFHGGVGYIAMAGSHQIWRWSLKDGEMAPFVGNGGESKVDGRAMAATLAQPSGLTGDKEWLYFADSESSSIRRVRFADATVETVVGGDPNPRNLFAFGDIDGIAYEAKLQHPLGVFADGDRIWVADTYNHKIKSLDADAATLDTFVGGDTVFGEPASVARLGNRLLVADTNRHRIRTVDLKTKQVGTLELIGVPSVAVESRGEIPGTEYRTFEDAVLKPGGKIEFQALVPDGWKFQKGPGAELRVGDARAPITGPTSSIPASEGPLEISVLYYPCGDDGICRIRSIVYRGTVRFDDAGRDALVLKDLVLPE